MTLEVARDRLEADGGPPEGGAPVEDLRAEAAPRLRAVAGGEAPRAGLEAGAEPEPADPAGARLLATQLAVSGSSREEIEARLRNRFEIDDPSAILDAIMLGAFYGTFFLAMRLGDANRRSVAKVR